MIAAQNNIRERASREYRYGFVTDLETDAAPRGLSEGVIRLIALAALALPAFVSIGDPSGASGGSVRRAVTALPAAEARSEEQEMTPIEIVRTTTMEEAPQAYPSAKVELFQRYHFGGCENRSYQATETLVEVHRNWRY